MDEILRSLLDALPAGWQGQQVVVGRKWVLATVTSGRGNRRAGLASVYTVEEDIGLSQFHPGVNAVGHTAAQALAQLAHARNPVDAAVGIATLNALLVPDVRILAEIDAADWLAAHGRNKNVAIVGRFPFVDAEIRPGANAVWVFELDPRPDEYGPADMPAVIPRADILAITSSTLVNHTLGGILAHARPETQVVLLGATTPLSSVLFAYGVDLLSGVVVEAIDATAESVAQGASFRHMSGLRRVSLLKSPSY